MGSTHHASMEEKFMRRVRQTSGCWEWQGAKDEKGYGRFYFGTRAARSYAYVHRWAYEHFVGAIPEGLQIDHLCRNILCVNPDHLEAVTQRENMRRGINGLLRTHCPHGHPYDEKNTYQPGGTGPRRCRTCLAKKNRSAYLRRRGAP